MPYNILLSDLVRDSKLETEVLASCLQHVFYDTGRSAHERRVRREERWVRKTFIGRGAYGSVYLEECDHGQGDRKLRAVKEIKKSIAPGDDLDYTRELEAVAKFSHPNYWHCFVRSHGWFELDDSVFITMEYLEHGDLEQHLRSPLPEIEARQITAQVLEGLNFMHQNGFIHRDLKPGNIMVVTVGPDWFVKITDFGISKRRHQGVTTLLTLQRGTFGYAAPEALGFSQGQVYTTSVDMWSLGAVDYRMLTGTVAFPGPLDLFQYASGTREFPMASLESNGVSQEGKDFITKLVCPDPKGRLTVDMAAQHSWMTMQLPSSASNSTSANSAAVPSATDNDTLISVASKAWSTDSNMTIPAALPLRSPNHQPPSVADTADEAAERAIGANYQPPSVSDCPEEPAYQGPKLPADSAVLLEPATAPTGVPPTVYPRNRKNKASHSTPRQDNATARRDAGAFDHVLARPAQRKKPEYSTESDEDSALESGQDTPVAYRVEEIWDSEESDGRHVTWCSPHRAQTYIRPPPSSESEEFDDMVTCDQCNRGYDFSKGQIKRLPCKHYMCHDCLLGLVALSLVSPKYMPPRCCDDPAGMGEINPLALPGLDLSFEVKDVWGDLSKFAELSRTKNWQWRCPRGHAPEDGSLLVSTGWTPVWKNPMNCDRCVVITALPIRDDLKFQDGQRRYQEYCLFCSERANSYECVCTEYINLVTDSFVNSLRWRRALGATVSSKVIKARETREGILAGKPVQYQAWEDVSWHCQRPPGKPLVDQTPYRLGGPLDHQDRIGAPLSEEDRLSCFRGWSRADVVLQGLDNWEIDEWRRRHELPAEDEPIPGEKPVWEEDYVEYDTDEDISLYEDWQPRRLDRERQAPVPNPFPPRRYTPVPSRPAEDYARDYIYASRATR